MSTRYNNVDRTCDQLDYQIRSLEMAIELLNKEATWSIHSVDVLKMELFKRKEKLKQFKIKHGVR